MRSLAQHTTTRSTAAALVECARERVNPIVDPSVKPGYALTEGRPFGGADQWHNQRSGSRP